VRTIIRVEHNKSNPYVQISRNTLLDCRLDLQAKGFLAFVLGKPDDWRIRPEALAKELRVSRASIYRIIERMIKAGYIHREIMRSKLDGRFVAGSIYIVLEDREHRQEWTDQQYLSEARIKYAHIPF
jgi:DNA-binding MarR family transcriptional regulator